jgi:mono/diheme cytochrome c family protein
VLDAPHDNSLTRRPFALALALLFLCAPACKDAKKAPLTQDDAAPSAAPPAQPPAQPPATMKTRMQRHFVHATTAKDTLLFGDLDVAMDSFQWLADNGASAEGDDSWEPHVGRIRLIAKDTLATKKLEVMGMAVAQIARECGSCHAALGVEPKIPLVRNPPQGQDFKDHMIGHKWALDRMWAGLTTPSSELWLAGASYLADQPTHLRKLSSYGKDADSAMTFASQVHALSSDAVAEEQSDRRMAIFGRFLAACAGCHALPASAPSP